MVKYECNECWKLIDENDTIMLQWSSGFAGGWFRPYCNDCYQKLMIENEKEKQMQERKLKEKQTKKSFWGILKKDLNKEVN